MQNFNIALKTGSRGGLFILVEIEFHHKGIGSSKWSPAGQFYLFILFFGLWHILRLDLRKDTAHVQNTIQ